MNFKNLPANWKVVRLGRVADIHQGKTPRRADYLDFGRFKILKVRDITENRTIDWGIEEKGFISEGLANSYKHYTVKENDILFTASAHSPEHIGKKLVIVKKIPNQFDYVFHVAELIRIRTFSKQLNPHFLYYLLSSEEGYKMIQDQVQGVHVYPKDLANLLIPLPPLLEQKRIVEILSLAEELINKQKSAIALIDKILMAKFLEMFGDPATNPKGWEVRRLGEILSQNQSGIWGDDPIKGKRNYPIIRSTEIAHDGKIQIREKLAFRYVPRNVAQNYILKKGDILVVKSSGSAHLIGRVALFNMEDEFLFSNFIQRLHPNEDLVLPIYLYFILNSPYAYNYIRSSHTTTTGLRNLRMSTYNKLKIPRPPLPLQQQFAQIVEEFEKKRKEMQNTLETLESLFKVLQKKAFTGELTAEWREEQKIDWELPKITERQAILLALLYYSHIVLKKPAMLTFAMKEAFLLQREAGLNLGYEFIPYKYGPFSKEVYEDLEELEKNLLVERIKPKKDVEMTEIRLIEEFKDWTEKIIGSLPGDIKEIVKAYIEKYGKIEFDELLDYVYAKYPEYAVKSKRKRKNKRHYKRTNKR